MFYKWAFASCISSVAICLVPVRAANHRNSLDFDTVSKQIGRYFIGATKL